MIKMIEMKNPTCNFSLDLANFKIFGHISAAWDASVHSHRLMEEYTK